MCFVSYWFQATFFFSSRDFMKSESNQNNKLFLLSQALSSLLLRSELSHTETDGSLTTMAFSCGSYRPNRSGLQSVSEIPLVLETT